MESQRGDRGAVEIAAHPLFFLVCLSQSSCLVPGEGSHHSRGKSNGKSWKKLRSCLHYSSSAVIPSTGQSTAQETASRLLLLKFFRSAGGRYKLGGLTRSRSGGRLLSSFLRPVCEHLACLRACAVPPTNRRSDISAEAACLV